jgi:hypothetical protein
MKIECTFTIAQPRRNDYSPAIIHAGTEQFANHEAFVLWLQAHNREGSAVTIAECVYLS